MAVATEDKLIASYEAQNNDVNFAALEQHRWNRAKWQARLDGVEAK